MGIFSYPDPRKLPKVNITSNEEKLVSECTESQILYCLRPTVKFCRLLGVFPCTYASFGDTLFLKYNKGGWLAYSFVIFLITSCYMIFHFVSLIISICHNQNIITLTAQSLWFNGALLSYLVSIFMFLRGSKLVQLFEDWCAIEKDLDRLFCPFITKVHVRRFQFMYLVLSILGTFFCGYHAVKQPDKPIYPFYYMAKGDYNEGYHAAYVIFQILILIWCWAGYTVLEGTCCMFATVIIQCMETLVTGLEFTFEGEKGQGKKLIQGHETMPMTIQMRRFMRTAVHNKMLVQDSNQAQNGNGESVKSEGPFEDPTEITKILKEDYLIFVIKKIQTVASLQSKINCIIGPLLLVDVAQLVILTCALTFLPVRFAYAFDMDATLTFVGNGVAVVCRLIIFLMCMGNVFSKGQEVNVALAKVLTMSNLSTACQNPVLAHLTVYSSNPISFTAWDFFPITKGTLLAAFSLISTYAVVFFQIKV